MNAKQKEYILNKYRLGIKNLPSFREHLLDVPEDELLESAPFHYEWSDI